jgi:DNA-binding PadR family transcriptional regulator
MSLQGALCALLLRGPAHGYELLATLEGELGVLWETRASQLYLTLGRMERDGLVTSTAVAQSRRPTRQILELTRRGVSEAKEWLNDSPASGDLVVLMAVARLVSPKRFPELVAAASDQRSALLRGLRSMRVDALEGFQPFALDAEITRVQGELRWLHSLQERADEIISRPAVRARTRRANESKLA